jgi:hypothetical protein
MTRIKTMSVWLENKSEINNLTWCLNILFNSPYIMDKQRTH